MERILVCTCHAQDEKAKEAFAVRFPGVPIPPVIKGKANLFAFAEQIHNEHLKAIAKLSGKFSYYVKINDDGVITEEYDLVRGTKIR